MSQPKVLLYTSKVNSDGTHPIVIRWYVDGKPKKRTVANIHKKEWNAKSARVNAKHPMHTHINELIVEMLGEAIVKGGLVKKQQGKGIIEFIESEADKGEKMGGLSVKNGYTQLKNDLLLFDRNINNWTFDDFTDREAELFYIFLLDKNNRNTASRKMSRLGTIFKRARKAKLTVNDPLLGMEFPKERTIKVKLTKDEVDRIASLPDEQLSEWQQRARDVFMMQFYLRGARVGDVLGLRHSDIVDGKAIFREGKTGSVRSILLRPEALAIIDRYRDSGGDYIIPVLKVTWDGKNKMIYKKATESATSMVNRGLKVIAEKCEIKKKVTTHIARHTFAKLAIDKLKNPRLSQELVGHKSLRVHQDYIRDLQDNDELDSAADSVFD